MRLRVLSLLSKGGTSVPVGSAADETKTGILKKQNEKITVAMVLRPARLSLWSDGMVPYCISYTVRPYVKDFFIKISIYYLQYYLTY